MSLIARLSDRALRERMATIRSLPIAQFLTELDRVTDSDDALGSDYPMAMSGSDLMLWGEIRDARIREQATAIGLPDGDPILEQHGTWAVTDYGLECLTERYEVSKDRLFVDEPHNGWLSHMVGKGWSTPLTSRSHWKRHAAITIQRTTTGSSPQRHSSVARVPPRPAHDLPAALALGRRLQHPRDDSAVIRAAKL